MMEEKAKTNHPGHYADECSLECIEVMHIAFGDDAVYHFCILNAFKYMWRHKYKGGKEDLEKAKWYLNYIRDEGLDLDFDDGDCTLMETQLYKLLEKEDQNGGNSKGA